jgi:hypothetical protein
MNCATHSPSRALAPRAGLLSLLLVSLSFGVGCGVDDEQGQSSLSGGGGGNGVRADLGVGDAGASDAGGDTAGGDAGYYYDGGSGEADSGADYGGAEAADYGSSYHDAGGGPAFDAATAPVDGGPIEQPTAGALTAKEWRDLDDWDFWLALFQDEDSDWDAMLTRWGFMPLVRLPVDVRDGESAVVDAEVALLDGGDEVVWATRTDVLGRAELFAGMFGGDEGPYTVRVSAGDAEVTAPVESFDWRTPLTVEVPDSLAAEALDLMFLVDTTGSMSDELSYIQRELADVIERVRAEVGERFAIRLSVGFYRDDTDAYVVRSFPFTDDIGEALDRLAEQRADGGGDFPEAVDQALEDALQNHEWSASATARLLFLVLDAPPHEGFDVLSRVRSATQGLAAAGVRVTPVTGSGIDKGTEFLMRFIAIATAGTYVFLTDDSGIGGGHLDPTEEGPTQTIPPLDPEPLNDLLVRLITEALSGEAPASE